VRLMIMLDDEEIFLIYMRCKTMPSLNKSHLSFECLHCHSNTAQSIGREKRN
jgi:hypothetical protein